MRSLILRRLFGLCVPPLVLCAFDGVVTLAGQSEAYWQGHRTVVNEASPTFHALLAAGPHFFVAGLLAWACVFTWVILLAPLRLALVFSTAVVFGHTLGAITWLERIGHGMAAGSWRLSLGQYAYQLANALVLGSAGLQGIGTHYAAAAGAPASEAPVPLRPPLRYTAIALLCAIGAYLFLWPRRTP